MSNNQRDKRPSNPDQQTILVVDDDVLICNIARIALESDGYFVIVAGNGEEALQLSRIYPGVIHALVTDVQMPKLDGIALYRQVILERPSIKVMLISGFVKRPLEGVPFLPKPFRVDELKDQVRRLLVSTLSACS